MSAAFLRQLQAPLSKSDWLDARHGIDSDAAVAKAIKAAHDYMNGRQRRRNGGAA